MIFEQRQEVGQPLVGKHFKKFEYFVRVKKFIESGCFKIGDKYFLGIQLKQRFDDKS